MFIDLESAKIGTSTVWAKRSATACVWLIVRQTILDLWSDVAHKRRLAGWAGVLNSLSTAT